MARWNKVYTTAGLALIAAAPGKIFNFTKAQCGSGHVDVSALAAQTSVSGVEKALSITSILSSANLAKLRLQLTNDDVTTAFSLYQIGIFAKLGTTGTETLFMILQADTPDTIPSATESPNFVNDYVVNASVENATSITATIDSAAYVTVGHITAFEAEIGTQMAAVTQTAEAAMDAAEAAAPAVPVTQTQNGLMTKEDKIKLDGIAAGATNYIHPPSHPATMITGDTTHRFVTDAQVSAWNAKADTSTLTGLVSDVARIAFDLAVQDLMNTENMEHVIVDVIDSSAAVTIVSGSYASGKVSI